MSPLITLPHHTVALAPQYFGSIAYYAIMARYGHAIIDTALRYDKRFKSVHRCEIVDTQARLRLTVPVSKEDSLAPTRQWRQMRVSDHAQWWADHRISLESAYGRTPFFEFYIDRFLPWLQYRDIDIVAYDCALDAIIRDILGIDSDVQYAEIQDTGVVDDYRRNDFPNVEIRPYYQVRADRLGFVPGLSILDLIFNMGPEAPLFLSC